MELLKKFSILCMIMFAVLTASTSEVENQATNPPEKEVTPASKPKNKKSNKTKLIALGITGALSFVTLASAGALWHKKNRIYNEEI